MTYTVEIVSLEFKKEKDYRELTTPDRIKERQELGTRIDTRFWYYQNCEI